MSPAPSVARIAVLALSVACTVAVSLQLKTVPFLGISALFFGAALFQRAAGPLLAALFGISTSTVVFAAVHRWETMGAEHPTMPIGAVVVAAVLGPLAAIFLYRWYARRRSPRTEQVFLVTGSLLAIALRFIVQALPTMGRS